MPPKTGEIPLDLAEERYEEQKRICEKLEEKGVPVWAIADINYQTTKINPDNKRSSRKIDVQTFLGDLDKSDLSDDEVGKKLKTIFELRERNVPFWAIADITQSSLKNVIYMTRVVDSEVCGKPWLEPPTLQELFVRQSMYFTEIAEIFGCHQETVRTSVDKHNVSQVESSDRTSSKKVRHLQRADVPDTDKLIDGSVPIEDVITEGKVEDLLS